MHVENVFAIAAQKSDTLLIGEKTELALGEVKERADARVGLAVVVAERALVITAQLSEAVVHRECPVVAEGLVHFELHSLVFTLGILVAVRLAVCVELAAKRCAVARLLALSLARAVWKQRAGRRGPRARVNGWEASASGRGRAATG